VESFVLGAIAWAIAFPLGLVLVEVVLQTAAAQNGILPGVVLPLQLGVLSLPIAIAFAIASTWIALASARGVEVIGVIRNE
jgi:hypothetical protein